MLTIESSAGALVVPSGGSIGFGRAEVDRAPGDRPVELELAADPRLHRRCGTVTVDDAGWDLANEGRWLRLLVVGLDRTGLVHLAPGDRLRVPWHRTRVEVHVGGRTYGFEACHARLGLDSDSSDTSTVARSSSDPLSAGPVPGATVAPVRVDRSAGYFRALVALCEPRLLDPSTGSPATDLEIARRLNQSGAEASRISGKTVERRLDLCRTRFGLKAAGPGGAAGLERRDGRRALVEAALLTATVTPADLRLLEPGVRRG